MVSCYFSFILATVAQSVYLVNSSVYSVNSFVYMYSVNSSVYSVNSCAWVCLLACLHVCGTHGKIALNECPHATVKATGAEMNLIKAHLATCV